MACRSEALACPPAARRQGGTGEVAALEQLEAQVPAVVRLGLAVQILRQKVDAEGLQGPHQARQAPGRGVEDVDLDQVHERPQVRIAGDVPDEVVQGEEEALGPRSHSSPFRKPRSGPRALTAPSSTKTDRVQHLGAGDQAVAEAGGVLPVAPEEQLAGGHASRPIQDRLSRELQQAGFHPNPFGTRRRSLVCRHPDPCQD
jgi:hypothetical protein